MFILECLGLPGEITSATVGQFLNRRQNTLILAKRTVLSLFSYDSEKFHLLDHKNIYRQVFSIHTVQQINSLDCLLVVSVNGEWLFLQWHENDFFALASGSIMDAALRIMKNPEQRRFRINPTFQWAILVIPQDERTCTHISNPNSSNRLQQTNEIQYQSFDNISSLIDDFHHPIDRVSLRALCFIDECVCIGLEYDGPGADLMYDISENMDETLRNIPQMCGWGDKYNCVLDNGLEHIWRAKQKNQENQFEIQEEKQQVSIAHVETFIFTEERINENDGCSLLLDTIIRIRHAAHNRKIQLPEFPFVYPDNLNNSFDNISSIYVIADTVEGVSLLSLNLDFAKQTIKLGSFAVIGLPNSSSRIITLKESQPINVQLEQNVNGSNLLIALKGQTFIDDSQSQAIILQQSINKAFIFPFPNTLPIPPFGFCHVYVEDRTELTQYDQQQKYHSSRLISQQTNQSNQFVHKLLLGGGKDISTIQDGQIQQQHYETKCINDIIIIQPKKNEQKPEKLKPKEQINKPIQNTTAIITTTSGYPIIMQLETGIIKEDDNNDDFCLPTGNIQQVINLQPKWQNKNQKLDDRMAFGVAHGISGTGEIQIVSVGHKLKEITHDDLRWDQNVKLFSSQYFTGQI
ncbi:MAG: hypothetical protein EZS28_010194 [Streblomastix strix]|uniref:RSE1/DDB1/CPSF1 first beta-propeller domain-containing protein n=1 Tax=Streblomastix strix TaxID=222440 RepID=A0A5J4WHZ2_9EUKA|nr:MAG: hypothetical protein EZS28_010194 [Streblomastix strix]